MNDAKRKAEELARQFDNALQRKENLWRYPLADAVVTLLEQGSPVTVDTIIARMEDQASERPQNPMLRGEILKGAIERLRQIVSRKD
ncbi:hypothetical protein HW532_18355 [Kaustia mangrovi]|uniref:Uncharacterized protein n=1 Tax=Kaustia mangrovi TaxID=2593653 RepID=A0A7S8C6U8_9HYPH|nr:hypothetical protein [Kaustia mangrovi]QPC44485.1 hypothetical protein HW532_18355 [Kaustia mangrovi]